MHQTQATIGALDVPRALRGHGKRSYVRLEPSDALPAKLELTGASGWRLGARPLRDLSVGGTAFFVGFWESRRVRVGETVRMRLSLGDVAVSVNGRCVHMTGPAEWWAHRSVGIAFTFDRAYEQANSDLINYLLRLHADHARS